MRGARRVQVLAVAAVAAGLALAPQALAADSSAHAAAPGCNSAAPVALDVAAAAAVPVVGAAKAAPLGRAKAQALLAGLVGATPCTATGTAAVTAKLAEVKRVAAAGDLPRAKRLLATVLASIRARRTITSSRAAAVVGPPEPARQLASTARSAKACPIKRAPTIDPKKADKVGDYIHAIGTAQAIHDEAGAEAAYRGAQQAYGDWAGKEMASNGAAKTVGDFVTIAKGAQTLGNDAANEAALRKARSAAATDVKQAAALDHCTATRSDVECLAAAIAVAQSLGADIGEATALLSDANQAVADRLAKRIPDGCEEWSFRMKLTTTSTDDGSTWTIVWDTGRFRVSRKTGEIDGSQLAGYGTGWPGIVGDSHGRCIEESPDGRIDHGPTTITGGPFRYAIGGRVADDGFALELTSEDAKISISAPGADGCQFLRSIGEAFFAPFVKGPLPLDIPVPAGQPFVNYSEKGEGYSFTLNLRRSGS